MLSYFGKNERLKEIKFMEQILAPLPIGFAVFLVHLATIPITGTGINPARSLGAAIIFNHDKAWDHHVSFLILSFIISLIS